MDKRAELDELRARRAAEEKVRSTAAFLKELAILIGDVEWQRRIQHENEQRTSRFISNVSGITSL